MNDSKQYDGIRIYGERWGWSEARIDAMQKTAARDNAPLDVGYYCPITGAWETLPPSYRKETKNG